MIDIHAHILPGVDDGPSEIDIACRMLAMAADDGITDIVATPHANQQYSFDAASCRAEMRRLQACSENGPRLHLGCELNLTPENLQAALRDPTGYTLNGKDCMLVELPENVCPNAVDPALGMLVDVGVRPIIAHAERNLHIQRHPEYAARLVSLGCFLQVTASSFFGGFGQAATQSTAHLMSRRMIHLVATDAHGMEHRRPLLARAYEHVAGEYGESTARLLFLENPGAAMDGAPVLPMGPTHRSRLRLFFLGARGRKRGEGLRAASPSVRSATCIIAKEQR
jgi:protein-tyrosine phosphatase